MKRPLFTLMILAVMAPSTARSQDEWSDWRRSETSGVEYTITNNGKLALDANSGRRGFVYPRDGDIDYLFGAGLCFGARKQINGRVYDLAFITFDPNSGSGWARPGSWTSEAPATDTYINHSARSPDFDRTSGIYTGPRAARPAWPLWNDDILPVSMAHAGRYVVDSAGRSAAISGAPAFVDSVAEQFVSRYHDGYLEAYIEGHDRPDSLLHAIGLQIEQNVYSFSRPGIDNTVILHYSIINVSGDTLRDCYAGSLVDLHIVEPGDDRATFYRARPELKSAIGWSNPER